MNECISEKTFTITRVENGWILSKFIKLRDPGCFKEAFVETKYTFEDQPNDPDGFLSYLQAVAKARPEYSNKFNELCRLK